MERYVWRVQRTDNGLYETEISGTSPTVAPSDGGAINTGQTTITNSSYFTITENGYINLESTLANSQSIIINASDTAGGIDIDAGTGGITIDTTNAISLDAAAASNFTTTSGNLTFDATAGFLNLDGASGINIGSQTETSTINIGTPAAARTITIGNVTGATSLVLNAGTGGVSIGNNSNTGEIQIGDVASAKAIIIGNSTSTSKLFIRNGTGGFIKSQPTPTSLSDAAATLTIAQLLTKILTITPTADRTITMPTAALAVAGISGVEIGDSINIYVINEGSSNSILVAMGTGGTLIGSDEIHEKLNGEHYGAGSGFFRLRFTNVTVSSEAYSVYRIG